ncbi:AI-2E family transporter [Oleiharenicola lentus]|jgi:predicted PurR-regulated permease PerM|uniref:AI-2E family transporter n=1 Tax=Oleiharenicola lentus TaxID=2508720 RepID=A0A4Q1CBM7_9BACT|nr:AI-2E family transporter [Oleiharenicola lentus]RXK56505.1 AI-2E family transporter [Oleiharenicola lentus]
MAEADTSLLSPAQRKLVGFALAFGAVVAIFGLLGLVIVMLGRFLGEFSGVIWPIATAGILALILRPVVTLFQLRLKLRRLSAVILLYALFVLAVCGVLLAFAPAVISQVVDFIAYLPVLWQNTLKWGEQHFPEWLQIARRYLENPAIKGMLDTLTQQAQDLFAQFAPSLKQAGAGIFGFFGLVASLAIIPVYLFFFLLSGTNDPVKQLPEHLTFLKPAQREDVLFLIREFLGIIVAFFRGQILIGLIMGVLLAIGFSFGGLRFGLALGLLVGLLNIVPYLGSILGLSVVIPLALLQQDGGLGLVAVCLGVFVAVQLLEGWLLTPRIMGQQTGLHPVAIIFAVFFWGHAFGGVLGMLLAVPLTAFFVTAWRLARKKYFAD